MRPGRSCNGSTRDGLCDVKEKRKTIKREEIFMSILHVLKEP